MTTKKGFSPAFRLEAMVLTLALLTLAACGGGGDGGGGGSSSIEQTGTPLALEAGQVQIDHGGFKLVYDCVERSAVRYDYTLGFDTGILARPSAFTVESQLPSGCPAQTNTASYSSVWPGYDRGHLVTSNHMDGNAAWLLAANHMSNIVPQVSTFNQGLWLEVENVAECYRDLAPVRVIGGVIYNDAGNDHFLASHGVRTPDLFWKLIVTTDAANGAPLAIAWLMPNNFVLNALDTYLVSVAQLEQVVGASRVAAPALPTAVRNGRPAKTWALPAGCNLS